MLTTLKQTIKRRLQYHIDRQLRRAVKDIELSRLLRATQESAEFVDQRMKVAKSYRDRFVMLQEAIRQVEIGGAYCEFGVYRGETINFIASLVPDEVHGFDSFEGLPEDWKAGHEKGTFAVPSSPAVRSNVRLHKGWFQNTIPDFKNNCSQAIAFLHVDADLYSSAKTIFEMLGDRIVAGTVIQFDEFFNYPGWREGEYKAFSEFCALRDVNVRYLGFSQYSGQVTLKIAKIASIMPVAHAYSCNIPMHSLTASLSSNLS